MTSTVEPVPRSPNTNRQRCVAQRLGWIVRIWGMGHPFPVEGEINNVAGVRGEVRGAVYTYQHYGDLSRGGAQ